MIGIPDDYRGEAPKAFVKLKDGQRLERTVELSRGSEKKFASKELILDKYEKLVRLVLPVDRMNALRDAVLNLEQLDDAAELGRLLALP